MATVTSNWIGTPSPAGQMVSNRRSQSYAAGQAAAFGIVPDEREEKATGVNPGGGGYVSGQVNPGAPAPTTGVARGTSTATSPALVPAPSYAPTPTVRNGSIAQPFRLAANGTQSGYAPTSDVTTKTSALSVPAIPGSSQPVAASGTTQGTSPIPTGASASPTVAAGKALGIDVPDPGGHLLTPTVADLSPALNSQARAFGLDQNLAQERYDYRPGEAPSQLRVQLDQAAQDQIRARQLSNLGNLEDAAAGRVVSPAELQLRRQAATNAATNLAAARALGGRSFGGATRAATLANAESGAQTNVDAAVMRAQEQERARQALIQALSGTRGQDIDVSQSNANLAQAANANNLKSQLDTNQLADQHRLALLKAQLDALGIGTQAGVGAVNAAAKNAASENESKQSIFKAGSQALAFL